MVNNKKVYDVNRKNFIDSMEVQQISINDIFLKEPIHSFGIFLDTKKKDKLQALGCTELDNVIIVKKEQNGYSLVIGYNSYNLAIQLNLSKIKAVVIDISRREFIQKYIVGTNKLKIKHIHIPKKFIDHQPKQDKINKKLKYYTTNKEFDKPVVVNRFNVIVDGYITYLLAKLLKIKSVPVKYVY